MTKRPSPTGWPFLVKDKLHRMTKEERTEKAVFVGIIQQGEDERKVMEYLDELEFLAETAGAIGDKKFVQRLDKPEKA